jgi:hypothetical protein
LIWIEEISYYISTRSEDYYKDIAETKEITGGMKGVKNSNDSASPSPFSFTKEFVSSNVEPMLFFNSLVLAPYRHPFAAA